MAYFANIIECEQDGTMANSYNCASIYFQVPFSLPSPSPSSLLKLPSMGLHAHNSSAPAENTFGRDQVSFQAGGQQATSCTEASNNK